MYFTTYISSPADLKRCVSTQRIKEVLIEPELCARLGRLTLDAALKLALDSRSLGLKPVLVWDILMTETLREEVCRRLEGMQLDIFEEVRVHDLGAAYWIQNNRPGLQLQLLAEAGCNNLDALAGWCAYFGPKLKRLVLAPELPKKKVLSYIKATPVPCEVLGAGPIQIFYSPRPILSSHGFKSEHADHTWIHSQLQAKEDPLCAFSAVENLHGTFLYHERDLYVLDDLQELEQAGLGAALIDLRHLSQKPDSAENIELYTSAPPAPWPRPIISAQQLSLNWDRIRSHLQTTAVSKDNELLGELISYQKDEYCAFRALRDFDETCKFAIITPQGSRLVCSQLVWRNLAGEKQNLCKAGRVYWTSWIPGAVPKSVLIDTFTS